MEIEIRLADTRDVDVLVEFNRRLAFETEAKQLDVGTLRPGVLRVLDDSRLGRYFVATAAGRVVGQLLITFEWSDWRNGLIWWLQSVYVESESRRHGVFRRLFSHVQEIATRESALGLRLYVENENDVALCTYQSLGMVDASYRVFELLPLEDSQRETEKE